MNSSPSIEIRRSRERDLIERLLANDYFDAPVCYFSPAVVRAAARWFAESNRVFFIVAEAAGEPAGYLFAHSFGPALWKSFAFRHPILLPDLAYVFWRKRRCGSAAPIRGAHARPQHSGESPDELNIPQVAAPFRWSRPGPATAYVDMVYVADPFRGRGLAARLLQALTSLASVQSICRLEAHIDPANGHSVRAFVRAGWNVVQTSSRDYQAWWTPAGSS